jgi:hypothetical protein
MKNRLFSAIVMVIFAFFAIKVIAFKNTVTRFDVIALCATFLVGFALSFHQALKRRELQRARRDNPKAE